MFIEVKCYLGIIVAFAWLIIYEKLETLWKRRVCLAIGLLLDGIMLFLCDMPLEMLVTGVVLGFCASLMPSRSYSLNGKKFRTYKKNVMVEESGFLYAWVTESVFFLMVSPLVLILFTAYLAQ